MFIVPSFACSLAHRAKVGRATISRLRLYCLYGIFPGVAHEAHLRLNALLDETLREVCDVILVQQLEFLNRSENLRTSTAKFIERLHLEDSKNKVLPCLNLPRCSLKCHPDNRHCICCLLRVENPVSIGVNGLQERLRGGLRGKRLKIDAFLGLFKRRDCINCPQPRKRQQNVVRKGS